MAAFHIVVQILPIVARLDGQQADPLYGLGHLVEVGQLDGSNEEVVHIEPTLLVKHAAGGRDGLGISHRHRPRQTHEEVVGIEANGLADVDARPAKVVLVVVGGDGLGGENVEDLLGDVLVGVLLHGVDVNVLDLAIVALFGVAHDVVGDQHHGIPGPDPLEHAGVARLLVVEVIGEVPLLGQVLAQQAPGIDVQRF